MNDTPRPFIEELSYVVSRLYTSNAGSPVAMMALRCVLAFLRDKALG